MYSTYSSTMDWFVVSHGKPWETDGLRPCTGPAVPGALQGEMPLSRSSANSRCWRPGTQDTKNHQVNSRFFRQIWPSYWC